MVAERILFVDDDAELLQGVSRSLRSNFTIETADSGKHGIEQVTANGPFAVVVSDMKMPEMNGAQFLSRVRSIAPETVRIAFTGQADMALAMAAVNEGQIFRFITKPCEREDMIKVLNAALLQYRLVVAEQALLQNTLLASVQVLAEMLSFTNPAAFGRAMRAARYVRHITEKLEIRPSWQYETAALLSQVGCVTLHPDTVNAVYTGKPLTPEDKAKYADHPRIAREMLSRIPRLEPVARMIGMQNERRSLPAAIQGDESSVNFGAGLLQMCLDYDEFMTKGSTHQEALAKLRARNPSLDVKFINALNGVDPGTPTGVRNVAIRDLSVGMLLHEDVRAANGLLIVSRGQEVTYQLIMRLREFWNRGSIPPTVLVRLPETAS